MLERSVINRNVTTKGKNACQALFATLMKTTNKKESKSWNMMTTSNSTKIDDSTLSNIFRWALHKTDDHY